MKKYLIILLLFIVPCAFADDGMIDLITSKTAEYAVPVQAKPDYLEYYTDSVFGTKVYRITGNPGEDVVNQSQEIIGTWPSECRHFYSKYQPWNADGSKIALHACDIGDGGNILILDGSTYEVIGTESVTWENRWHPTDPDLFIYETGTQLRTYDISDNSNALLKDFSSVCTGSLGWQGEGNITEDFSLIPLECAKVGGGWLIFAYNVDTDTIYDGATLGSQPGDWTGITQNGSHVIVNDSETSNYSYTATTGIIDQTFSHDISHYDLCVDTSGNQVAAGIGKPTFTPCGDGTSVMIDVDDGTVTCLHPDLGGNVWGGVHNSCRNTDLPGWVYSSYTDARDKYADEIVATRLDGSGSVRRFCHMHHSWVSGYDYEAKPVPSRDGRRVMFTSDWDNTSPRYAQTYIVDAIAYAPIDGVSFGDGL